MRFAFALVTLVAAVVLIATGIAQRTVLRPADHVTVSAEVPAGARYVVVPGSVLRAHPGQQRLRVAGDGATFAAYGRTSDVTAWLAGERYAELRAGVDGAPARSLVRTAPAVPGVAAGGSDDPDGSDLWLDQRSRDRRLDWTVNVPASVSLLVAADGTSPAPRSVSVTWPLRADTPLAVPFIVAGGALGALGLLLYVWALVHVRRRRGPRRKSPPKMPKRPQPPKYRPARPAATGPGRGRRSVRQTTVHRWVPATAVTAIALVAGGLAVPAQPASAAPRSSAAVGEGQAQRIVQRIAEVARRADAERDTDLLATRFAGPAMDLRTASYRIRAKDEKAKRPQAIPGEGAEFKLILPEATDRWPRTLFTVLEPARRKTPPVALTMVQDTPRSRYTVRYAMSLRPGAVLPDLPAATVGGNRLDSEAAVLDVAPAQLARDYGALLRDTDSDGAKVFDTARDPLADGVGEKAKKKIAKRLGRTAGIAFKDLPIDPNGVVALSTADSGALVSAHLEEQWTVKPKRSGVTVKPSGGTSILAKTRSTKQGIASVYGYQLLFSVPSAGSDDPVVLLGYSQGLVSAKEL